MGMLLLGQNGVGVRLVDGGRACPLACLSAGMATMPYTRDDRGICLAQVRYVEEARTVAVPGI